MNYLAALPLLALACSLQAADLPHRNYENHPQNAIDLSPDGSRIAVAHTADQRVQWFVSSELGPVAGGHTVVGVDPVSVRFRGNDELWVVNHLSDSISIIDVASRQVTRTLPTGDEPFDVVFANGRAFVSCSQINQVWVYQLDDLTLAPTVIKVAGEDPRGLAVSADGSEVAVAIFESGNASTVLPGGFDNTVIALPNAVGDPRGPYGGQNPPPNSGSAFEPPLEGSAPPPNVGLIVKRAGDGRWMDDNHGDWSRFVSGDLASQSLRRVGWNMPDRDIALINTSSLAVQYVSGLMNIGMAISPLPGGGYALVGTDGDNEIRFEPNVKATFLKVLLATVGSNGSQPQRFDLNPHLDYSQRSISAELRQRSIGDPRAVVWHSDGERGWVAGLGSNNVIEISRSGQRRGNPIEVAEGPIGLALDEARGKLYVWSHFALSLSVIDVDDRQVEHSIASFNPLPDAIRQGRKFLYDTHATSGLGQASCASCHIDSRMDRLAWDLGDPSHAPAPFDQNCVTAVARACEPFHAMKGPMVTQTLQDIIGHEPHHWRGDRRGIEAFNPAFIGLLGRDSELSAAEMQQFEDFLATIYFPPNPFRAIDNSLPRNLALEGHYTSGRFSLIGQPLGHGDAVRGLVLFTQGLLDAPFQCASCHTLPTGMAVNGPLFAGLPSVVAGGSVMPIGPMGENHLGVVSIDGSSNVHIKVPQLRNQHEKVGYESTQLESNAGFGFLHDGSVDSLSRFLSANAFDVTSDQDVADLTALMLSFAGGDFSLDNPALGAAAPQSKDSHAGVGAQTEHRGGPASARLNQLLSIARDGKVDLVVHGGGRGYRYLPGENRLLADDGATRLSPAELQDLASQSVPQTWTLLSRNLATRFANDRDGDGISDAIELQQGSNPADADSISLRPAAGLWFNPARNGHGLDLQFVVGSNTLALTWYTYNDDGSPTWYQAVGPFASPWQADLLRYRWNASLNRAESETVGSASLSFDQGRQMSFQWQLGNRSGSEPMLPLLSATSAPAPDHTGIYFDVNEPGWGLSINSAENIRGALMYFYDDAGEPRWSLGLGDNRQSSEQITMLRFTGFCPDCPASATPSVPAGTLSWRFSAARALEVDTDVAAAQSPSAPWRRQQRPLTALSQPYLDPRWQ
ncbi:YncE family protein [Pseudomarimonas arenosa]|uniref:YncE family protein n=1 Tax=Pseudomarimonas arenosa TaxID=2774145 RepID=A0AAW3ZJH8_9GAMM|nr:YncE family protein [Pseudomarimonas arenosa]MBD8525605.1 YncE family protein [Pseudomarimonas arenosa]